jgi:GntR family transcriptional regulator
MHLQLNFRSGIPVYLQIVQQVQAAVAGGASRPGDPLPSVRALAEELRINRNTAAKAYAELEAAGVVETRAGRGCFIREDAPSPLRRSVRAERIAADIDALLVQAHHLQLDDAALLELFHERLAEFHRLQASRAAETGNHRPPTENA